MFASVWMWTVLFVLQPLCINAQVEDDVPVMHSPVVEVEDSVSEDSVTTLVADDTVRDNSVVLTEMVDSVLAEEKKVVAQIDSVTTAHFFIDGDSLRHWVQARQPGHFIPDPKKAMWLAIVIPGGGQVYNHKYWKLPLVYGGFLGCVYAMSWNNTMYRDYSQAYIDIMDNDENTKSYENFIPSHYDIEANKERLKELFKRKKNYYRRFRDLSMFCMIGVYALSIIDAYVDAEMSSFDISRDLTLRVNPAVINENFSTMRAVGLGGNAYGLQCSLCF